MLLAALAMAVAAAPAAAAPAYPDAVVLVSGYNSASAFTTPDPSCEGKEGDTWSHPTGPAAALRDAGLAVFTAPVQRGNETTYVACTPGGTPAPPASDYIDSYGDNDANGAALGNFLAFLRDSYGVQRVQIVAHSDGGNWSRSAFTQDALFAGLDVRSLNTLGTPYTGSLIADLGTELRNGRCDFDDPAEQDLCEALLDVVKQVYDGVGPTAVRELTHTYLEGWNPGQRIGPCPVTTIAGTAVEIPGLPFTYYSPSDGLVGEASAEAKEAYSLPHLTPIPAPEIPGLIDGGTFPVVHAPSLSFISPANLLNTQEISDAVTASVSATPSGPLCDGSTAGAVGGAEASEPERHVEPFRITRVAGERGWLGTARTGDIVLYRGDPSGIVSCGGEPVADTPLLGNSRLRIAFPVTCGQLQVRTGLGRGDRRRRPPIMLLRSHPFHKLAAKRSGRKVKLQVLKGKQSQLVVRAREDGRSKRLKLKQGRVKLPRGQGPVTLTATIPSREDSNTAVATVTFAR